MFKKIILLPLLFIAFSAMAQYPRASIWTAAINNFAAQDAANGVQKDVVLFAGSSTFTMWTGLQTDFPESKVLNRAFGGSMMTDLLYYFNQVIAPYNPRQVVLYEGDNDLHGNPKTPEEYMDDVIAMTRLINIYFPSAEILLVSIKPSPSRTETFPKYLAANTLMQAYAAKHAHITYVDTWAPMLKTDGTPESAYFGSDMLHMNAAGYSLWKTILKPYLLTSDFEVPDKVVFTESSHPTYHDFSWVNVTAPSTFVTPQAGKMAASASVAKNGTSSLKLEYQSKEGGDWMAAVAGPSWVPYDVSASKSLEFWVYASQIIAAADLPYLFLETVAGAKTPKIAMSNFAGSIAANEWKRVSIPIKEWKDIAPNFDYTTVKTIFFSQFNVNANPVLFYVDDVTFKAESNTTNPNAQGDMFIDFGSNAAGFPTPGNWNNVHDHQAAKLTLINDNGDDTGIELEITDPFYGGFNTNGPATVSGNASIFPGTACSDNFFGHGLVWGTTPANPTAAFTLKGLDPSKYYSFAIFASRMGVSDNREAKYSIADKNGTKVAHLDGSNNASNVANIANVQADATGTVTFSLEAGANNNNGSKFFYLGAMRIQASEQPSSVNAPKQNAIKAFYNNGTLRLGEYTGIVEIFDTAGRNIASGQAIFGHYAVHLPKGAYLIYTDVQNSSVIVQ